MTTQTAKVKNGTIILPKELRRTWKGAEVFITGGRDTILIKKTGIPSFSQMLGEFRKIGKKIRKKDVREAINWAQKKALEK